MTGQIEELQNANRKLVEQLQRFQQRCRQTASRAACGRAKRSEAAPVRPIVAVDPAAAAGRRRRPPKARRSKAATTPSIPMLRPMTDPGRPKPLGSVGLSPSPTAAPAATRRWIFPAASFRQTGARTTDDTIAPTLRLPPRNAEGRGLGRARADRPGHRQRHGSGDAARGVRRRASSLLQATSSTTTRRSSFYRLHPEEPEEPARRRRHLLPRRELLATRPQRARRPSSTSRSRPISTRTRRGRPTRCCISAFR